MVRKQQSLPPNPGLLFSNLTLLPLHTRQPQEVSTHSRAEHAEGARVKPNAAGAALPASLAGWEGRREGPDMSHSLQYPLVVFGCTAGRKQHDLSSLLDWHCFLSCVPIVPPSPAQPDGFRIGGTGRRPVHR